MASVMHLDDAAAAASTIAKNDLRRLVEARKDAIVAALRQGRDEVAARLTAELVRDQDASGRKDLTAKSLCSIGKQAERLGHLAFAERALQAARARASEDPIVWAQLVALAQRQGNDAERLALSAEMMERFPGSLVALGTRASALRGAGLFEASLAVHDEAAARFPGDPHVHTGRVVVLVRLGRLDAAERAAEDALARFAHDEFAWTSAAGVATAKGELARAARTLREAADRFPEGRVAHLDLADTYVSLGRANEGLRVHDELVARHPRDLRAARARTRSLAASGKQELALRTAARLVRQYPASMVARTIRAEARHEAGELLGAVADFGAVEADRRLDDRARLAFASTLMALGTAEDLARAGRVLEDEARPTSAAGWCCAVARGLVAMRRGDPSGAERELDVAAASPLPETRARARHALALGALLRSAPSDARAHLDAAPRAEHVAVTLARAVIEALLRQDASAISSAARACPLRFNAVRSLARDGSAIARSLRDAPSPTLAEIVLL